MKARDIIPGWPRGRSTLPAAPFYNPSLAYDLWHMPIDELTKIEQDLRGDRDYHLAQAQMMHEYLTKTGRFKLNDTDFKIVGFAAKP